MDAARRRELIAWWASIASSIAAIIAIAPMFRPYFRILAGLLLLASLCFLFYIILKRKPQLGSGTPREYLYPKRIRYTSTAILILLPIGMLLKWQTDRLHEANTIRVVIADFSGPDPDKYRVSDTLYEKMQLVVDDFPEIEVSRTEGSATIRDARTARRIAEKERASVLIWGSYGATGKIVPLFLHFDSYRWQRMTGLTEAARGGLQQLPAEALFTMQLQTELARSASYLTLLAAGFGRMIEGKYKDAERYYSAAINLGTPGLPVVDKGAAHLARALLRWLMGSMLEAINDVTQAISLQPSSSLAYFVRAQLVTNVWGPSEKTLADLNKAIRNRKNLPVLQGASRDAEVRDTEAEYLLTLNIERARSHAATGDTKESLRALTELQASNPTNAEVYLIRGNVYYHDGNLKNALEDLTKAIELQGSADGATISQAYSIRGAIMGQRGDFPAALHDFSEAIRLYPSAQPYVKRAYIYMQTGDRANATRDFESAVRTAPTRATDFLGRGIAWSWLDNADAAKRDLTIAAKSNDSEERQLALQALATL